jgi:hypothetical protein
VFPTAEIPIGDWRDRCSRWRPEVVDTCRHTCGESTLRVPTPTFTGTPPHTYNREGLSFSTLIATDSSGRQFNATTIALAIPHVLGIRARS